MFVDSVVMEVKVSVSGALGRRESMEIVSLTF